MPTADATTIKRRRSRILSVPVADTETDNLRRMNLALRAECNDLKAEVDRRAGYWRDDDVRQIVDRLTAQRDDAQRAIRALTAELDSLRVRYAVLEAEHTYFDSPQYLGLTTVAELTRENRSLRRKLHTLRIATAKHGKLRPCRAIKRRAPIEDHYCNPALPKQVKDAVRRDGCHPEADLGVGEIVLVTCEAIRLADSFVKSDGCWEWTSITNRSGYGQFAWDGRGWMAHRFVYTLMVGPIPFGLTIDHLCQNRRCVRPDHLEPVLHMENSRRRGSAPLVPLTSGNVTVPGDWSF